MERRRQKKNGPHRVVRLATGRGECASEPIGTGEEEQQ